MQRISNTQATLPGLMFCTLAGIASASAATPGSWTIVHDNSPVDIDMSLTNLADGRVLLAGGGNSTVSTFAEVFSPRTNKWQTVAPMNEPRDQDTATLLPDGTVLAAGGTSDGVNPAPVARAEIYDPRTNTWTLVGAMNQPRFDHVAVLLRTGKVLLCGGTPDVSNNLSSCELYNPKTRGFTLTGDMGVGRRYSALVTLPNGDVMIDGDQEGAEIYAVSTGTWHSAATPPYYNFGSTLTLLGNGTVMETPSDTGNDIRTEIYDPATDRWSLQGSFTPVIYNTANLLRNGNVLSAGGCTQLCSVQNVRDAFVFNPKTGQWTQAAPMNVGREDAQSVTLRDGRVLVVGGYGPPEVFRP